MMKENLFLKVEGNEVLELEKKINKFLVEYAKENDINQNEIRHTDELVIDMFRKVNPNSFQLHLKSLEILEDAVSQFSTN